MTTAIELAKQFETCRLKAYPDNGRWAIGWGHDGPDICEGMIWTQAEADAQLLVDIEDANRNLKAYSPGPFPPGAEDSLTDFVFNLGIGRYRSSTLRTCVNSNQWTAAKTELLKWNHVNGAVSDWLTKRRKAEADNIQLVAAPVAPIIKPKTAEPPAKEESYVSIQLPASIVGAFKSKTMIVAAALGLFGYLQDNLPAVAAAMHITDPDSIKTLSFVVMGIMWALRAATKGSLADKAKVSS